MAPYNDVGIRGAYGQSLLRRMSALEQTADGIRRLPSAQGRIAANEFAGMIRPYFLLPASCFIRLLPLDFFDAQGGLVEDASALLDEQRTPLI